MEENPKKITSRFISPTVIRKVVKMTSLPEIPFLEDDNDDKRRLTPKQSNKCILSASNSDVSGKSITKPQASKTEILSTHAVHLPEYELPRKSYADIIRQNNDHFAGGYAFCAKSADEERKQYKKLLKSMEPHLQNTDTNTQKSANVKKLSKKKLKRKNSLLNTTNSHLDGMQLETDKQKYRTSSSNSVRLTEDISNYGNYQEDVRFVEPLSALDRISITNWWEDLPEERVKNRYQPLQPVQVESTTTETSDTEENILKWLRNVHISDTEIKNSFTSERFIADQCNSSTNRLGAMKTTHETEEFHLTLEQEEYIQAILHGPTDVVLISKFKLNITRRDIQTLMGHNWLNDEIINFYMNLIIQRSDVRSDLPRVYAMNTFFMKRLLEGGYNAVRRWTRKIDIFTKDIIPVPVHVNGVHWCMAIIHLRNSTIRYYDPMGDPNPKVLVALEKYLQEESLDKRQIPYDTSAFDIKSVWNIPRQHNGSDCGVFSCMFAEYITRNRDLTFSQKNMKYFRKRIILEICRGELLQ